MVRSKRILLELLDALQEYINNARAGLEQSVLQWKPGSGKPGKQGTMKKAILSFLRSGEPQSTSQICRAIGTHRAQTREQLARLVNAGLVKRVRPGIFQIAK